MKSNIKTKEFAELKAKEVRRLALVNLSKQYKNNKTIKSIKDVTVDFIVNNNQLSQFGFYDDLIFKINISSSDTKCLSLDKDAFYAIFDEKYFKIENYLFTCNINTIDLKKSKCIVLSFHAVLSVSDNKKLYPKLNLSKEFFGVDSYINDTFFCEDFIQNISTDRLSYFLSNLMICVLNTLSVNIEQKNSN